ncbi:MAG: hypothetical protein ACYDDC_06340, partial [Thermoplasmataceae archaeon]
FYDEELVEEDIPLNQKEFLPVVTPLKTPELSFKEREGVLSGWGGKGIVRPMIPEDLPLIWSKTKPIGISKDDGAKIELYGATINKTEDEHVYLDLNQRCSKIIGKSGFTTDVKIIRGVDYNDEIKDVFRLNMLQFLTAENKAMTMREILEANQNLIKMIKGNDEFEKSLKIFERTFYGNKDANRSGFETFLRGLIRGIYNPKTFMCGDN